MDLTLSLISGIDIPIPECQLILHQPTIKEISYIGEADFFVGAQCLCINKSMYEQEIPNSTNFQIFMMLMQDERAKDKKASVKQVLTLLFPDYRVIFTPRSISFNQKEENFIIDEENFEKLQEVLKQVFCLASSGQDNFNPGNKAAKDIADKLMRARQRVAAQKQEGAGSVFTRYLSVLTVGLHSMSLSDLLDLTIYQLYDIVERYILYINWDLDVRTRLAGGTPDSKPDDWMKNIH